MQPDALQERNRTFYNGLWRRSRLYEGDAFNTWPMLKEHVARCDRRLEIGPGMKPRLPIEGTTFLDLSEVAVEKLEGAGASAHLGSIDALPFEDDSFDMLCALDVIEHVSDDEKAFSEIARVLRPGGTFILSIPLSPEDWTEFDATVGHARRYELGQLRQILDSNGFKPVRSAVYGMMPKRQWITTWGMRILLHMPGFAMKCYNAFFLPMIMNRQATLEFKEGLIDEDGVNELIIECTI